MYSIETISLYGNPIVNSHPQLAQIKNNQPALKSALQNYFGIAGNSGGMGIKSIGSMGSVGGMGGMGIQGTGLGGRGSSASGYSKPSFTKNSSGNSTAFSGG